MRRGKFKFVEAENTATVGLTGANRISEGEYRLYILSGAGTVCSILSGFTNN